MKLREVTSHTEIASAAKLSTQSHGRLRSLFPFLPSRSEDDFMPRIEWVRRKGVIIGLFEAGELKAYLGAFPIDNLRNAGPGSFGPDWCHGATPGTDLTHTYRLLYRELAPQLISLGCLIHSFSFYASESEIINAMELTGFGCIVMDAARATKELLIELPSDPVEIEIVRARPQDAVELSRLDFDLAAHIAKTPVLMPNPRSKGSSEWADWLLESSHIAFLSRQGNRVTGFIKAEEPQYDVSYAVHGESTLAINGMYVEADFRCTGVGKFLLASLVREAAAVGKEIVSVDCETTNLEAYAFWTRWFEPVAWGLERRV